MFQGVERLIGHRALRPLIACSATPEMTSMSKKSTTAKSPDRLYKEVLASAQTGRWLRAALRSAWRRNPNDVLADLAVLEWLIEARCRAGTDRRDTQNGTKTDVLPEPGHPGEP